MTATTRDVLNVNELTKAVTELYEENGDGNDKVKVWLNTVCLRYLIREYGNFDQVLLIKEDLDIKEIFETLGIKADFIKTKRILRPDDPSLPEWAKKKLGLSKKPYLNFTIVDPTRPFWNKVNHVIDWIKSGDGVPNDITKISFDQAVSHSTAWVRRMYRNVETKNDMDSVVEIAKVGNYRWVQLVLPDHFKREGKLMKNCIGSNGYFNRWNSANFIYFSLRDEKNEPHVTVEIKVSTYTQAHVVKKDSGLEVEFKSKLVPVQAVSKAGGDANEYLPQVKALEKLLKVKGLAYIAKEGAPDEEEEDDDEDVEEVDARELEEEEVNEPPDNDGMSETDEDDDVDEQFKPDYGGVRRVRRRYRRNREDI